MKQVDIGGLSFAELRENDKYYVDKTLLIKDLLERDRFGVYLFTRPRRFGKTTNLSMLDAFFNIKYKGNTWFDGLAISDHPGFEEYKNRFPVVYLDLKNTKALDSDRFQSALAGAVLDAFKMHPEVMDFPKLMTDERYLIDALNSGTASYEQVKTSAKKLTDILERIHGSKVVVLIDEYDRAVSDSYGEVHQKSILDLLGEFLNAVLKSNRSLQMAYVTGIMQIAKASIFSDLNNVVVDDVLSVGANERFGFTADEVKGLLAYYPHSRPLSEFLRIIGQPRSGAADPIGDRFSARISSGGYVTAIFKVSFQRTMALPKVFYISIVIKYRYRWLIRWVAEGAGRLSRRSGADSWKGSTRQ